MARKTITRVQEEPALPPKPEIGIVHHIILSPGGLQSLTVVVDTKDGIKMAYRTIDFAAADHCITVAGEMVDPGQLCMWFLKHAGGREVSVVLHPERPGGSLTKRAEFTARAKPEPLE